MGLRKVKRVLLRLQVHREGTMSTNDALNETASALNWPSKMSWKSTLQLPEFSHHSRENPLRELNRRLLDTSSTAVPADG